MTDVVVAASETAFSRLAKARRKVYGSVAEEQEEKLLTASDFLDEPTASQQPNEKSLFGNDDDEDNDLSVTLENKGLTTKPAESACNPDKEQDDGSVLSNGGDEVRDSDETMNDDDSPSASEEDPATADASPTEEKAEEKGDDPTENDGKEKESEETSDDTRVSKRERKLCATVDMAPTVEEKSALNDEPALTQTTDEQPNEDALIASVDNLFTHADKETVTVKDIVLALQVEFGVKLAKKTKMVVRERLKSLVQGTVEADADASDKEEEEEEDSESQEENAESEEEFEQEEDSSDFEEEVKKPKMLRKKKKITSKTMSSATSNKEPRKSSRRGTSSKPKKPSAVRIHAEMLRKNRMDELRVRNEELQVQQNKEDQERAEQIAARFDTNTDELRMKRVEDRLDLLRKLDQKRIQVLNGQDAAAVPVKVENTEVPSAAATSDSDSDSDSDMELEIIGEDDSAQPEPLPTKSTNVNTATIKRLSAQSKALSILSQISSGQSQLENKSTAGNKQVSWSKTGGTAQSSPGKSISARAALRRTLLSRQRQMGNLWLARELGYKSEQDHLRDCLQVEKQKRVIVIKTEEARLKANEHKQLRERMLLADDEAVGFTDEPVVGDNEVEDDKEDSSSQAKTEGGEDEDEELAMAKAIENEQQEEENDNESSGAALAENDAHFDEKSVRMEGEECDSDGDEGDDDDEDKTIAFATADGDDITVATSGEGVEFSKSLVESSAGGEMQIDVLKTIVQLHPSLLAEEESAKPTTDEQHESTTPTKEAADSSEDVKHVEEPTGDSQDDADLGETEFSEPTTKGTEASTDLQTQEPVPEGPKKAKNSGWQEMLRKEAENLKQLKKRKGGGLVEAEADEEEEEDVVAGLEDFGFSMGQAKKDDGDEDEEVDEFNEEDLKHVVDELSDDEGDEEAGEQARKDLMKREDKEQHKEMLRRMREGYDGRRGGIAGGGVGARGLHRFDQLVAADNREDAKRLGLLNDDELDSEDEDGEKTFDGKDTAGEIDDETALLDKMLKDRFLHRSSVETEEHFSDDEEEQVKDDGGKGTRNDEDAEERKQEFLARRFAKRARMQRLLETHGEDEEFSQLRLIDEDQSMKKELMSMKDVAGPARRQKSTSSESQGTSSSSGGDSQLGVLSGSNSQSLFGSQSGSLILALKASRQRKNKTSFLGGSAANKDKASQVHKSVALSHVVFNTENSQSRGAASTTTAASMMGKRKRKVVTSSSLWDKVAANSFKKKRY